MLLFKPSSIIHVYTKNKNFMQKLFHLSSTRCAASVWCFSWYFDDSVPTSMKTHPRGLSHFSITDCRSTFVFPFLDKRTRCSWNALPNRVKDLWRGGAAIDHNRGERETREKKKNKEEERKQDWVESTVTQSYFSNSRSHYTALNRETLAWDIEEDMHL